MDAKEIARVYVGSLHIDDVDRITWEGFSDTDRARCQKMIHDRTVAIADVQREVEHRAYCRTMAAGY